MPLRNSRVPWKIFIRAIITLSCFCLHYNNGHYSEGGLEKCLWIRKKKHACAGKQGLIEKIWHWRLKSSESKSSYSRSRLEDTSTDEHGVGSKSRLHVKGEIPEALMERSKAIVNHSFLHFLHLWVLDEVMLWCCHVWTSWMIAFNHWSCRMGYTTQCAVFCRADGDTVLP